MKKKYYWIAAIVPLVAIFSYFLYPVIVHNNRCNEMGAELQTEYNKLDFSCQKDENCFSLSCSECLNKNSYIGRYSEIYNEYFRKEACDSNFVDYTCLEVGCKCSNNKCIKNNP
jgi:hypothetical protein